LETGSGRKLLRVCPGAGALPWVGHTGSSEVGSAIHDVINVRVEQGWDASVEALPAIAAKHGLDHVEEGVFRARALGFTWMPPEGSLSEVPLSLAKGPNGLVGVRVKGGQGKYDLPEGCAPFAATIDVMWAEPEPFRFVCPVCATEYDRPGFHMGCDDAPLVPTVPWGSRLVVGDLKAGKEVHVEPVEQNAQIGMGAVLAAHYVQWEGEIEVVPALLYVRRGPGVLDRGQPWDAARVARELKALASEVRAIQRQQDLIADGQPLDGLVVGEHCGYCPAFEACPAKTASVAAMVGEERALMAPGEIPEAKIVHAVSMLQVLDRLGRNIRDAAKAHVGRTGKPLPLAPSKGWGPHPTKEKVFHAATVFPVLADVLGEDGAWQALGVTAASIKRVLESQGLDPVQVTQQMRAIFFKAAKVPGALVEQPGVTWGAYRCELDVEPPVLSPSPPVKPGAAVEIVVPEKQAKAKAPKTPKAKKAEKPNPWTAPVPPKVPYQGRERTVAMTAARVKGVVTQALVDLLHVAVVNEPGRLTSAEMSERYAGDDVERRLLSLALMMLDGSGRAHPVNGVWWPDHTKEEKHGEDAPEAGSHASEEDPDHDHGREGHLGRGPIVRPQGDGADHPGGGQAPQEGGVPDVPAEVRVHDGPPEPVGWEVLAILEEHEDALRRRLSMGLVGCTVGPCPFCGSAFTGLEATIFDGLDHNAGCAGCRGVFMVDMPPFLPTPDSHAIWESVLAKAVADAAAPPRPPPNAPLIWRYCFVRDPTVDLPTLPNEHMVLWSPQPKAKRLPAKRPPKKPDDWALDGHTVQLLRGRGRDPVKVLAAFRATYPWWEPMGRWQSRVLEWDAALKQ
jgi:hypothetical protein